MKRLANQKNKIKNGIIKICQSITLSLAIIAQVHFAYAQSTQGGIIPNGKATFLDQNGKPLSSGQVFFYTGSTGSTTPKTTYQDINQTVANTNPVTLDAAGRALLWGTGNYRQIVKDKNGNTIWDQLTSVATGSGSGGGGTATGDGNLVGTIMPWAGITAPNQYMFTYGQEVSRTTYAALFTAITSVQAVFCISGSAILTGLGDTTNFWVGMTLEVSCVSTGNTTIISKTANTVTMAVNANVSTNTNATFFPWGRGNGTTTFNLPDFRGLIPMGNNIMGGVASTNISDTYFGSALAESAGAKGGSTNGGYVNLATSNLPPYTPAVASADTSIPVYNNTVCCGTTVSNSVSLATSSNTGAGLFSVSTGGGATTITMSPQGGTSTPFGIIPPSKTVNYIIKVTPDANSATASGVTSLGGMTGSIACGANLNCTGNTISSTAGITNIGGMTGVIACGNGINCSSNTISGSTNYVTPAQYGAACDGITNDAVALQNMITASAGKSILIPAGTCLTNSTLVMPSNTTIIGSGREASILKSTAFPALAATDKSYISLTNFQILGTDNVTDWHTKTPIGPISIVQDSSAIAAGTNYTISNMKFAGWNTSYWVYFSAAGSTHALTNITFSNNYILTTSADIPTDATASNNSNYGFVAYSGSAGNGRIENTMLKDNRIEGTGLCHGLVLFSNHYKFQETGNMILNMAGTTPNHCVNGTGTDNNSYAILVYDVNSDGNPPTDGLIANNTIISPLSAGIYMVGDGTPGHTTSIYNRARILISGNLIDGQSAQDDSTLPRGAIVDNLLTAVEITGNEMHDNFGGIAVTGQMTDYVSVIGNHCSTGAAAGASTPFCIRLDAGSNGSSNTDYRVVNGNVLQTLITGETTIRTNSATGSRFNYIDIKNNSVNAFSTGLDISNQFVSNLITVAGNIFTGAATTNMFKVGGITGSLYLMANTFASTSAAPTFAQLPTSAIFGSQLFISDGAPGSSPCTGTSTGSTAFRQNSAWKCF